MEPRNPRPAKSRGLTCKHSRSKEPAGDVCTTMLSPIMTNPTWKWHLRMRQRLESTLMLCRSFQSRSAFFCDVFRRNDLHVGRPSAVRLDSYCIFSSEVEGVVGLLVALGTPRSCRNGMSSE